MITLDDLAGRLDRATIKGDNLSARCPAHTDNTPSLTASIGDTGAIVVHCHAGCDQADVLAALNVDAVDLFPATTTGDKRRIVKTYPYLDAEGRLVAEVVRYSPKDFRQRRPDGRGGVEWKAPAHMPLYRLPDVLRAVREGFTVWICEGEKDADALQAVLPEGEVATSCAGGAKKWKPHHTEVLVGADVIIVRDRDDVGKAHAATVAEALRPVAAVTLCEPFEGKDVYDHLYAGRTLDELVPVTLDEPEAVRAEVPRYIDWEALWAKDTAQADWLYEDVLARGRGHAFYAAHKLGKSLFLLWVCLQLAKRPDCVVVYLDFEMTEEDVLERLEDMGATPADLARLKYALLPALPPLDTAEGGAALDRWIEEVQRDHPGCHVVAVIDTTSRVISGRENDSDTFIAFYRHTGMLLKRRGVTWARLDHAGKDPDKAQRGSSAKGDDVDLVWRMTRVQAGVQLAHHGVTRIGWAPDRVTFNIVNDPLRYVAVQQAYPAGTKDLADLLDTLDVPVDTSANKAAGILRDAQQPKRRGLVQAAVRYRRQAA